MVTVLRTIVSFVSDHGYSFGEHGQYAKNTNFEESVRVPWIMHESRDGESLEQFQYQDPMVENESENRTKICH